MEGIGTPHGTLIHHNNVLVLFGSPTSDVVTCFILLRATKDSDSSDCDSSDTGDSDSSDSDSESFDSDKSGPLASTATWGVGNSGKGLDDVGWV